MGDREIMRMWHCKQGIKESEKMMPDLGQLHEENVEPHGEQAWASGGSLITGGPLGEHLH